MTPKETRTTLAALRYWQRATRDHVGEVLDDEGLFDVAEPLTSAEIDRLCARLRSNLAPAGPAKANGRATGDGAVGQLPIAPVEPPAGPGAVVSVCEFCGKPAAELVAALEADHDQHVCAECHADPRVPTLPLRTFEVRTNCEYSAWRRAVTEVEAIEAQQRIDLALWDQAAWAPVEAEEV